MNSKHIALLVTCAATVSGYAQAQQFDTSFPKRIYLGVGAGNSQLEPDTGDTSFELADDSDSATSVTVGVDLTRRLTVEASYADLGVAGLTNNEGVEYTESSVSGLYYLWNGFGAADYLDYDGLDRRAGVSFYGRAGLGKMENDSLNGVSIRRENDVQVLGGLGVEYGFGFGLGVRAEYIRYDSDAIYKGLSVLYRIGGRSIDSNRPKETSKTEVARPAEPELPTLPAPTPEESLPPPPKPDFLPGGDQAMVVDANDTDGDGVGNSDDECNATPPGTPVNNNGCAMFNGTLEGVNFLTGSDTLTDTARVILDDVVATLNSFPEVRVSVQAHTDSRGDEAANLTLSRKRALAVVRYLTAQGIELDRLEARAYGETQPIADNDTRDGRLINRRVEFKTVR